MDRKSKSTIMETQPDKFFREKLEGYQRTIPPTAWERIETGLDKKKTRGLWIKIAASLSLLAITTYLLWPAPEKNNSSLSPTLISEKEPDKSAKKENPVKQNEIPEQPVVEKKNKLNQVPKADKPLEVKINAADKLEIANQVRASDEIKIEVFTPEISESMEVAVAVKEGTDPDEIADDKSIKIILSSEEVNEKYFLKNKIAEATPEEKKSSTLRKLLDKAYDLKHNQDPVGELRQMKNEILALNFKNDKQRGQNK